MGLGLEYHWAPLTGDLLSLHSHKEGSTPPQYKKNVNKLLKTKIIIIIIIRLPIPRRWNGEGGWVSDCGY